MPAFIFLTGLFGKRVVAERQYDKVVNYFVLYLVMKILIFVTRTFLGESPSFKLLTEGGTPWFIFAIAVYYLITMHLKNYKVTYVLCMSILLACFVGYDKSIGDYLVLSRIIVFYPFFYVGYVLDKNKVKEFLDSKTIKVISAIILFVVAFVCIFYIDTCYGIRPLLTGRNSYSKLSISEYGAVLRLAWYFISSIMVIAFLSIVPDKHCCFTDMGARTLQVYALHRPIIYIWYAYNMDSVMQMIYPAHWKVLTLSVGVLLTIVLSMKVFEKPFLLLMNNKLNKTAG